MYRPGLPWGPGYNPGPVLAYLAAIDPGESTGGRLVIGGVLINEPDLKQLQALAGPVSDLDSTSALALLGAESVQPFGLVCDPDIAAADCERCFSGLYRRVRAIIGDAESAKQTQGSLFMTLACSDATYAQGWVGLTGAAAGSGSGKYVFVDRSPSPPRIGGTLAASLAGLVASGFPEVPAVIAQLLVSDGKPAALLHYTLREKCMCFACRLVREAVYPPTQAAKLTDVGPWRRTASADARRAVKENQPTLKDYSHPLHALRLPPEIFNRLLNAGIRTVGQLQATSDRDLFRLRDIGKRHVDIIRSAIERYLAGQ